MYTFSREFRAQYADESAENTDPFSFKLPVPIFKALSRTATAGKQYPAASSSCPITEITTNEDLDSFMARSCSKVGSSLPKKQKKKYLLKQCHSIIEECLKNILYSYES